MCTDKFCHNLRNGFVYASIALFFASSSWPISAAEPLPTNNKNAAKDSNIAEAESLNGTTNKSAKQVAKEQAKAAEHASKMASVDNVPTVNDSAHQKSAKETANVVNQIPGVKVNEKDLEPPAQPPITGFHPIKKLLRPVENLEGMSIKLEQQIMKLEGPIAGLQPPMLSLQKKMTGVDEHIGTMQTRLDGMQAQVQGVRTDISDMRKDINSLKQPIEALRAPIGTVAAPLESVNIRLNLVLVAILLTAVLIVFGTPIAAILVYRYRHRLFPGLGEHELPKLEKNP
jgi:chromosome segregation ATPase